MTNRGIDFNHRPLAAILALRWITPESPGAWIARGGGEVADEVESLDSLEFWVTEDEEEDSGTMGVFRRDREAVLRRVPLGALRSNLTETVDALQTLFEQIADRGGPLPLKEVQLSFQVSASGGVQLVGSSQVQGTRGITFVFGN